MASLNHQIVLTEGTTTAQRFGSFIEPLAVILLGLIYYRRYKT
jgi:EamA domain-containing membrane protein RarD